MRNTLLILLSVFGGLWIVDEAISQKPEASGEAGATAPDQKTGKEKSGGKSKPGTDPLTHLADSLQNPRASARTFMNAMVRRDHRVAVTALDFSELSPAPDIFEQIEYAEMLKACIDRISLVDPETISDDPNIPEETFPPDDSEAVIRFTRGDDGLWRVSPTTLTKLVALYEVLKDKPVIGGMPSVAPKEEPDGPKVKEGTAEPDQPAEKEPAKSGSSESSEMDVPDHLKSPRRVMQTLLQSLDDKEYEKAVSTLDVSEILETTPDLSPYSKIMLARQLKDVILRLQDFDYAEISDDPQSPTFGFPIGEDNQPITIIRQADGVWQFSAQTVASIPALHELYKDREVIERAWYRRRVFMGNELWRILFLFGVIFASLVVGRLIRILAMARSRKLSEHGRVMTALAYETVAKTVPMVLLVIGLALGIDQLTLGFEIKMFTGTILHVLLSLIIGYIAFRLVDVFVGFLREVAKRSGSTLNDMLVPLVSTSLRLTVIVLVALEVMTAVSDKPPSAVIAGLGAGGLAIGLAAQDTIKNFFGSVLIFADRPFELGDRIVVDGHDGPVEAVGFRSTRIRTLDGHLVTVPNGEMAARTIQNIGKRPYIRRVINIRLAYDMGPEKADEALRIVRELLHEHDGYRPSHPPRVFLHDFFESAVNLRAIYWYHPPNYWDYCDFGERLNLEIMQRFQAAGIRFALPSQRLFVAERDDDTANPS